MSSTLPIPPPTAKGIETTLDPFEHGPPALDGGHDVQEDQLVRALTAVGLRGFNRIAGIPEIDEVDTFDHSALFDVQTRYDLDLVHSETSLVS
jgi:hypothetical protein